jgi:Domain of Unknown Function (DUF1080)
MHLRPNLVMRFAALALAPCAPAQSSAQAKSGEQYAAPASPNTLTAEERTAGWRLLFNGVSLDGWKASDKLGTFSVANGQIVVRGPTSHLFYLGPVQHHDFTDFELRLDVMTYPGANSGVYFHTEWQEKGWPDKGYEVQVNNSHADTSRTGGLWGIRDNPIPPAKDRTWFTLSVTVQGKHVVTKVDDKVIVDYTEEDSPVRPPELAHRLISHGTFALQGHDPKSEVHYRNVKVRPL